MKELVRVYKRKSDGLTFVQFGEDLKDLWCDEDLTGESDLHRVSPETIAKDFELIEEYEQEAD